MKKNLLLLIAFFSILCLLPIKANAANVEIKEVKIEQKSEGLTENSEPTFKDLKVNFDLGFENLNDSIKYKLTLKNNDEIDYEVSDEVKYSEGNHIKYEVSYEGTDNIVKAGTEKVVYITVTYANEVPIDKFTDGVYKEDNNVLILLNTKEKNPNTLALGLLGVAIPLLILSVVVLVVNKNKMTSLMSFAVGAMLLLPLIGIAVEKIEIEISSKITIEPPIKTFSLIYEDCVSHPQPKVIQEAPAYSTYESEYKAGMTWVDFFDSDYFDGELEEKYVSMITYHDSIIFYKEGFMDCMNALEYPEWDDDLTEDENYELQDEYYGKRNECFENYEIESHKDELILPKEEGQYYIYYCPKQ